MHQGSDNKNFDAVVIGAGIAGLTSAVFLAQGGVRVLVCEQSGQVGGLFNSFRRAGYHFDGGIKAVENSAVMMPMLAQLGLLDQIGFQRSPIAIITGGRVQAIQRFTDVEAYFSYLETLFPSQQAGLRSICRDAKVVFDLLDGMLCFPIPFFDLPGTGNETRGAWFKGHGAILGRLPRASALMNQELRPYLEKRLTHAGLINLLSDLFPDGTSAFFGLGYFRMFLDYHYPRGGVHTIPRVLREAIEGWDGQIRLNTRVERVLLSGNQARGVRLEGGEEIEAGYVIAASDLRQALTELAPEDRLPERFRKKLGRADVSHSVFNVFLGVNRPVEDFYLQGCQHLFYHPDLDGISEGDRANRADYFAHVPQEISVPCLHQPDLAPPGKTGINISAMTTWQYMGGWNRGGAEYETFKECCAQAMIQSLEKQFPGLAADIDLCITASPRTIVTLTSNRQGAIMGWSYHRERTLPRGNFLQMRASVLTPISRLLTAGHWSFSPGGSPVAVLTGKLAAEHILQGSKNGGEST